MSQKNFQPQLRNIFKNEKVDSETFWRLLQSTSEQYSQNIQTYCQTIFEYLYESTFQSQKQRKYFYYENYQKMYTTLLALEFYKNRNPKAQHIVNMCKKLQDKIDQDQLKWILKVFRSSNKDQGFFQGFASLLVSLPLQLDWQGNVNSQIQQKQRIQKLHYNKVHQSLHQTSKPSVSRISKLSRNIPISPIYPLTLSYICFLDYIRSNENSISQQEYKHLIEIFKALLNYTKIDYQYQEQLCVFLHFLMNCITYYSCQDEEILKQFVILTGIARNCWGVVGELANQLFEMLIKEIRIPGWSFRKKIRYDFPALDIRQSSFLSKQYYIITHGQDAFSCPEDRSLLNLRKQMIAHLLKISCIDNDLIEQFLEMIKIMAQQFTYQIYFKALKIIQLASQLEVFDKIRHVTREKMIELIEEYKLRFKKQTKRAEDMEIEEYEALTQEDNALSVFRYPLYEITHIPLSDFVNLKSKISFFSVLRKTRAQQSNLIFYKGNIPIIFYGTSTDFIGIVRILCRFLQEADIEECRQLQLFYIPKPQSSIWPEIGSYIAEHDLWYRTFIYGVFKEKKILPYLQLGKENKNLIPSYLMNKSLHIYLRQAKRILFVNVYKCYLKIKDVPQVESVYFTNGIHVGLFAQAQIIRMNKLKSAQKKGKYENCSVLQIIKQKLTKPLNLFADIDFTYLQPFSSTPHHKKQSDFKFESFQLTNIPHQNFFGPKPDPQNQPLTLSLLTDFHGKTFIREITNQQNFKQNKSASQVYLAFQDIFINYSITALSMRIKFLEEKEKDKDNLYWKVIIDGVVYNKVEGLDVEIPVSVNGLPISLPIMTFLPFK